MAPVPKRTHAAVSALEALAAAHPGELSGAELIGRTGYRGGTLYPLLGRLAAAGLIVRREETRAERRADPNYRGQRTRHFHTITTAGVEYLKSK